MWLHTVYKGKKVDLNQEIQKLMVTNARTQCKEFDT